MRRTLPAAAIGMFLLTGCGPEQATADDFAAIVAEHDTTLRDSADNAGDCLIAMSLDETSTTEKQGCVTIAKSAQNALITIRDEFTKLGDPPDEIADLVQSHIRAGDMMETEPDVDIRGACSDMAGEDCSKTVFTTLEVIDNAIIPLLDSWEPYL